MIVLLGDRYGWVPPEERIAATAQEAGFTTETVGKSVTALEIEFGILQCDPGQRRRCRFYFRDPLPYAQMLPALAAEYSDAHAADPAVRAAAEKLERLKRRIEQDPELGPRVRHYRLGWNGRVAGLEAWGQQVLGALWADLDEETRAAVEAPPTTWQEQEDAAWSEFLQQTRSSSHSQIFDQAAILEEHDERPPRGGRGEPLGELLGQAQSAGRDEASAP